MISQHVVIDFSSDERVFFFQNPRLDTRLSKDFILV